MRINSLNAMGVLDPDHFPKTAIPSRKCYNATGWRTQLGFPGSCQIDSVMKPRYPGLFISAHAIRACHIIIAQRGLQWQHMQQFTPAISVKIQRRHMFFSSYKCRVPLFRFTVRSDPQFVQHNFNTPNLCLYFGKTSMQLHLRSLYRWVAQSVKTHKFRIHGLSSRPSNRRGYHFNISFSGF